jgi:hypothetical protein
VGQLCTLADLRINLVLAIHNSEPWPSLTTRSIDQFTRQVRLLGKFFRRLQVLSVRRFVSLPRCTDMILFYWEKVVRSASSPSEMTAGKTTLSVGEHLTNML